MDKINTTIQPLKSFINRKEMTLEARSTSSNPYLGINSEKKINGITPLSTSPGGLSDATQAPPTPDDLHSGFMINDEPWTRETEQSWGTFLSERGMTLLSFLSCCGDNQVRSNTEVSSQEAKNMKEQAVFQTDNSVADRIRAMLLQAGQGAG